MRLVDVVKKLIYLIILHLTLPLRQRKYKQIIEIIKFLYRTTVTTFCVIEPGPRNSLSHKTIT